ncbi:uncharacterized protein BXIN_2941 [Babesia sp. Xinjiang]|uniref:uncharacterized protein n=1 Tax=Babesia sp. Xinjiang TaxID=462227 RepID=UPI000A259139|nr:uncharacterized protein BXIN_2941 [Babesia sp. Xinjiang]ORM39338.1 hypothetical protein BXIN_2941 [Babesia sp. Xinjiang]
MAEIPMQEMSHMAAYEQYPYAVEPQDHYGMHYTHTGQMDADYIMESEVVSPRGEQHTPMVGFFSSKLLRSGLTFQCSALTLMFIFYWAFGGNGVFVFDLYAAPESVKISRPFHLTVSSLQALYLLGTFYVAMFQVFVSDNSKAVRGFRAGSKILSAAVTLDLISSMLRLVQYIYAYFYMSMKWWTRYQQTKADWIFFQFGSFTNSFALVMYGAAFFYLEAYHDEGTSEDVAWTNLVLFCLAGLTELLMVFTGYGALFSLFLLAAILSATVWSFSFEPLLEKWSPSLHSRDVNADFAEDVYEQGYQQASYIQEQPEYAHIPTQMDGNVYYQQE